MTAAPKSAVIKLVTDAKTGEQGYEFWCLGCRREHVFRTAPPDRQRHDGKPWPVWSFDGNTESPSFVPSLHHTHSSGRYVDGVWVKSGPDVTDCHLHVTAGRIIYCADSPHYLAGRTADMVRLPQNAVERGDLIVRGKHRD